MLPGRLPAYITEEEYRANIARLDANRETAQSPGAPGTARRCCPGCCVRDVRRHRMAVSYHEPSARAADGYTWGSTR